VAAGPVAIAYDGSPYAGQAMREAAELLSERHALVVTVWKQGIGVATVDEIADVDDDLPPGELDVRTAAELDEEMAGRARRLAEHGAALARAAGFEATSLVVAEEVDVPVAETLLDVARQRDARAVVLGSHGHNGVLGRTSRDVIRGARCPVIVRGLAETL
jgi:nucleotide-binding universal stress UspA family protein